MMYFFKPNGQWNAVSEKVYLLLYEFYGTDQLQSSMKDIR